MTADDVAALVAEIRRYHQPIDDGTECDWCYGGDENKWPCPPARAAAALEAQQKRIEALERVRPRPELVAMIRANHTRYEHIAFCRCGQRWPCEWEEVANALDSLS